ncbi:hypothetical protein H2200_009229 [Cladophialophora chaetospira]|uniref:Enoyl reductase (ER) domain-containing protein n=1 Tax=Cladophialophora chaetospira TaxID=386627 RepID=A0AA38X405_9EURO|nr:hypothetical protein H2200_009229 [Cladophialophora chaetospira]
MTSTTTTTPSSTSAIVVRQYGEPPKLETLSLGPLRADEALVEIHATGICHSDLHCLDGVMPKALPNVLGHEGAGVVLDTGSNITHVSRGDKVLLSFDYCGSCDSCTSDHPAYCPSFGLLNIVGARADESTALTDSSGVQVGSHFFGQSSFARHTVASARSIIKVPDDTDLKLYAPLGCGIQTGAGTVLNSLKVTRGSSLAVWGVGSVGLAALMAGVWSGAKTIIAIDLQPSRLELAREMGATATLNGTDPDLVEQIMKLSGGNGVNFAVDCTGVPKVIENMINTLGTRGRGCSIGVPKPGATVTVDVMAHLSFAREYIATVEGDSDPSKMIPYLIKQHKAGLLPLEKMNKYYAAKDFQAAFDDMKDGKTIKPVLVWSD